jgi:hypothetical protein
MQTEKAKAVYKTLTGSGTLSGFLRIFGCTALDYFS